MKSVRCPVFLAVLGVAVAWTSVGGSQQPPEPPWEPAYKIKPHQTDRLTAADVVGPDGIVYPDWRYAGVPGGIPAVAEVARIEQFGGKADDGKDDSRALASGARAVARRGGGALVLGSGTYHLDRPVVITGDGVVIRGQGAEATKIVFRYAAPQAGVGFFSPGDGDLLGPDTHVEIHATPDDLRRIAVEVDGQTLAERKWTKHWGGTYSLQLLGDSVTRRVRAGSRQLTAVAEWTGGRRAEAAIDVKVDPSHRAEPGGRVPGRGLGAITFSGDSRNGATWTLAADGKRGDYEILLSRAPKLKPGDAVELNAPATPRWNRLVENACQWGSYRCCQFRVEEVDGRRVRLNQPLRIDFPRIDGSTLERIDPVRRCGVEDLSLVQTKKLWTCGVLFSTAWECWARGVNVTKAGKHAIYSRRAKWCEIRDCRLDDAWYHGGGGTAYVGWERSYDCLMEDVTTWRMRHAPCVQWSSAGNVIRKCTFHGSDAQWHAGWTNENLFEQCVVDALGDEGSYGHGAWASPPEDTAHGPQGPRNVVYNCDLRGSKTGLWMGGMNENWLILYNRIRAGAGPGIYARNFSFDHVIRGNTIAVARSAQPAVQLVSEDCTGVEILQNKIYGAGGQLVGGRGRPLVAEGNTFAPYTDSVPRPTPEVPSIFLWQRDDSRHWVGGDGDWSDPEHWSATAGGQRGAGPPARHADAIFDQNSGNGVIRLDCDVSVRDLLINADAGDALILDVGGKTLHCTRDCLLMAGSARFGKKPDRSTLVVGRNLDTSNFQLGSAAFNLHLVGTGWWRYRLKPEEGRQGDVKPRLWNFLAAAPGRTTTLRPVGIAPVGIDVDVANKCIFGDRTSRLAVDLSEATNDRAVVTLEIGHSAVDGIDIVADGCRLDLKRIEHEYNLRDGPILLQNRLDYSELEVFDITGRFMKEAGSGPTWKLAGPLEIPQARLSIEKTCVFDTGGHDLLAGSISVGNSSGVGELHLQDATVTVRQRVSVGGENKPGRLDLGTGTLRCKELYVGHAESVLTGRQGAVLEVTDAFFVDPDVNLDLGDVTVKEKEPQISTDARR